VSRYQEPWYGADQGYRNGDVPDLTADPALAEKELGFRADEGLEAMCRDQWAFQEAHPNGYEGSS
jgi:UDP-glucose 4-epimerase